jgi:poly-gamma-glutamate synthesis protein (capsule biosynthesis protein)
MTYPPTRRGESGYFEPDENAWIPVPYVITNETKPYLEEKLGRPLEGPQSHHIASIHYGLEFDSPVEMARYPFRNIAPVLREADIAFANLETPLSERARNSGAFVLSTAFADGLRWAGIDVVTTANNHALDAEGEGLVDTKAALREAGIGAVGTGINLEDARRPYIIERDGIKIAFLGYAQFVNAGNSAFALEDYPGVVPLDPFIIKEDIRRVRDQVDYVAVSFHWAIENSQETHPMAREFAYDILDAGADIILGGHPHVPRGVEVYKGKVIFYCFGNLIFGHNHTYWMDNYLGRLTLARDGIMKVEILPVAGRGTHLSQPYLLEGEEAQALLEDVQGLSAKLDTRMEIVGDVGLITP